MAAGISRHPDFAASRAKFDHAIAGSTFSGITPGRRNSSASANQAEQSFGGVAHAPSMSSNNRREKRSLIRKTVNFAPSTWEQLELFMAKDNVHSISAFLHSVCDRYAEIRSAQETINIAQQKVGRKIGNQ